MQSVLKSLKLMLVLSFFVLWVTKRFGCYGLEIFQFAGKFVISMWLTLKLKPQFIIKVYTRHTPYILVEKTIEIPIYKFIVFQTAFVSILLG